MTTLPQSVVCVVVDVVWGRLASLGASACVQAMYKLNTKAKARQNVHFLFRALRTHRRSRTRHRVSLPVERCNAQGLVGMNVLYIYSRLINSHSISVCARFADGLQQAFWLTASAVLIADWDSRL